MAAAIVAENLGRTFKTYEKQEGVVASIKGIWNRKYVEKAALHPTTLTIEKGQIVGLVGANGAGKTTLLKLLSGLIHPTQGTAQVLGYKPWERNHDFLRKMSILLGQKNQLWWDIAAIESYGMLTEIYDLDRKKVQKLVRDLSELLNCAHVLKTQLRRLSLGERMKMEIIGSLLHEPEILFLDEPTIGLDIVAQTTIRKFLAEYVREKQPTVILTSHYMDDIAKLADRLFLMSNGRLVYDGTVSGFVEKSEPKQLISFSLSEPLQQDMSLPEGLTLKAGEQQHSIAVHASFVPNVLGKVTQLQGLQDLKLTEADFETVIGAFLEKESSLLQTGRRLQP